jgi:sigma-E factor negative regulatory protein RseB
MRGRHAGERAGQIALALALALTAVAAADEPERWLEKMNQALMTRNYDGIFSHWQGGRVETLRIIHRVQDGAVMERLVSLDGSGREFIRTGSELACYLPDQRTVLVERQPQASLLLGSLPAFDATTSEFYDVKTLERTRLLGQRARLIAVTPKDEYRYGYRLWIAESTGMPLKTQLCDRSGRIMEQVVFASIATPVRIPDSAFKPEVPTDGFQWLRNESGPAAAGDTPLWNALKLPPGFRMSARAAQLLPGSDGPVAHLVFTDGIASVSVFVQSRTTNSASRTMSGTAQVGSATAFSTVIDGHQVTAVGEVPERTVRFIVDSVKEQGSEPALSAPELSGRAPRR